jgi:predicted ribosomally synthesized peptide with SipW-like signal peptide
MMQSAWRKWSVVLIGIAVVGVAGATYASFNASEKVANSTPPVIEESAQVTFASVWDENIQPYLGNSELTVYRSPTCGCCGEWVKHMERHGFRVKDIQTQDMDAIKAEYGVPQDMASCHTAMIDGYVLEGHIPADDVKALLTEKPDVAGITVPGMPLGSPGMEAGDKKQDFMVMAFDDEGDVEIFQEHRAY